MNETEFLNTIKSGKVPNPLFFIVENEYTYSKSLEYMCKKLNLEQTHKNSYEESYGEFNQKELFSEKKKCFVIRNDPSILKENFLIKNKLIVNTNNVVLVFNNIDKRSKIYKKYSKNFVQFKKATQEELDNKIKKNYPNLKREDRETLIRRCGCDLGTLYNELDKVRILSKETNTGHREAFKRLLDEGVLTNTEESNVFEVVKFICDQNYEVALDLFIQTKPNIFSILSLVYNEIMAVYLTIESKGLDINKTTNLNYYQIKQARSRLDKYTANGCTKILNSIFILDGEIKFKNLSEIVAMKKLLIIIQMFNKCE